MNWSIKLASCFFIVGFACARPSLAAPTADELFQAYGETYPEVHFVHLENATDLPFVDDFFSSLGDGAKNIDYEHPTEARQTLLEAQAERIRLLLNNRMPSATLFKTGSGSRYERPYVCVVTLDETVFSGEPLAATRFFADDMEINAAARLENEEALAFSFEHEIFHCLDSYLNGALFRMTSSEMVSSYDHLRAEQRADYFAALALRSRSGTSDRFISNLAMFRTLSLVTWDLSHYTAPALLDALAPDQKMLRNMDLRSRVQFVLQRAKDVVMSEEQYWDFVAAAVEVSITLGQGEGAFSPLFRELVSADRTVEPEQVAPLLAQVRQARLFVENAQVSKN